MAPRILVILEACRTSGSEDAVNNRKSFVLQYAALKDDTGLFFADEAHFRVDAELPGKWVLRGEAAMVDSDTQPHGAKASYCSALWIKTGEAGMDGRRGEDQ